MKIATFFQERQACNTIRLKHPTEKIAALGLAETHIIGPHDPDTEKIVKESDVVFIGRAGGKGMIGLLQNLKFLGKKVVYDLDDTLLDISPLSPHYKDFGIMPVEVDSSTIGGKVDSLWQDGVKGFDVRRNRRMRKSFIEIVRAVDCLTVTTPPLQRLYSRMNDNVRLVPNAIDFGVWGKRPIRHDGDEIRLLYTGASNHYEDWVFVAPVLAELQKEYPKLKIVLTGIDWKMVKAGIDYSRVEFHPWVDIEAYPYLLQSVCCDIGIAPISKIDFNDCRSSIKWLEYSALKMATVATDYGPYKRDMKDGVNGLLVDDRVDWKAALSRLIEDVPYRKQLALQAYKHCKATYDLDYVVDEWMSVFTSVNEGK